jgi:hypothetical protein
MMNWKTGNIFEAGRRFLVKNVTGADPHRIFEARSKQTTRGIELELPAEDRVLRGRDMQGLMHVPLAA